MKKLLVSLFLTFSSLTYATDATWNLDADGNWNNNANWNPTTFPNAVGDTANFLNNITANRTITLGQTIAISVVNFDSANNYRISGNTLSFPSGTPTPFVRVLNNNGNGAHTIASTLNTPFFLGVNTLSTSDLTFSGAITGSGAVVLSGTGNLVLSGTTNNTAAAAYQTFGGTLVLNKTPGINAIGTGGATINAGVLSLGNTNQIANTAVVTLAGGTFNMNGFPETIGQLVFTSGTLNQGGATLTLSNANSLSMADGTVISGNIALGGAVTKTGTGAQATISGDVNLGTAVRTFNVGNTSSLSSIMEISGAITGTGSGGISNSLTSGLLIRQIHLLVI